MITLLTGAPGTGKTSTLVDLCSDIGRDRPLFVYGLDGFLLPHVLLDDPHDWMNAVPDGAAVIIDEVQAVWRPRGPGSKVPPDVASLETHRHRGLDFFLTTQGPNLLDANVRSLVGRHIHLRDLGVLGRWWYEWPECADQCRTGWRGAPIKKRFRLKKSTYALYKSASVHVKPIRSFPMALLIAVTALVATIGVAAYGYHRITSKISEPDDPLKGPGSALRGTAGVGAPPSSGRASVPLAAFQSVMADVPRTPGLLHTAPRYDELRKAKSVPYPAACVSSPTRCECYTDQQTRLPVPLSLCRQYVADGFYRDWAPPPSSRKDAASPSPLLASPEPSSAPRERVVPTLSRVQPEPDVDPPFVAYGPIDVTVPAPSAYGAQDGSVIAFMRAR